VIEARGGQDARRRSSSGESITKPLRESGVFPPMVTRMIDVGERTGALETMLTKIADFYEDQVNAMVCGPDLPDRTAADRVPRRGRRLHRDLDVHADVQDDRAGVEEARQEVRAAPRDRLLITGRPCFD
jgi:hypothetical protein